jgi:glutamate-1-semialdehyde 2,1-aminomutase
VKHTLTLSFNDVEQLRSMFASQGESIAAVIVEPIAGNMNMILPEPGYLEILQSVCREYGAVLILDEVMTGFRVAPGGAQSIYGIEPDLTTLAKVIGGGMPVGAVGGRAEIMNCLSPVGSVYQAGTLSGNPLAMAAGLATLTELTDPAVYDQLSQSTARFCHDLQALADAARIPVRTVSKGGMFGVFFMKDRQDRLPTSFTESKACDEALFNHIFHRALEEGIYLPASRFEAGFMSLAHTNPVLDEALEKFARVFH